MVAYSFWIFDRHCNCVYSREWTQVLKPEGTSGTVNAKDNEDNAKLLFGALFSLRNIARKVGDTEESENTLRSFATSKYRAHFYESPSGLRFCVLSDVETQDMQQTLRDVYSSVYVEQIVKNPLSPVDFKPGTKITNQRFIRLVDRFLGPA